MKPTTIKLFLVNGSPDGLRTAELSNWSGKAVAAPRSQLDQLLSRQEVDNPGVYILLGFDEEDRQLVYIGEAERVRTRLKQHVSKDFWQSAIVFISKDENLTKAHIKFLEGELIGRLQEAGRAILQNSQSSGAKLPESDKADMDGFLEQILQLLPILGLTAFRPVRPSRAATKEEVLHCRIKGLEATGNRTESGFVIYKDSQAVLTHRKSAKYSKRGREKLIADKIMVPSGEHLVFIRDVEFSSPSAAAAAVRGGASNGLTNWKDSKGRTLKDIEGGS